MLRMALLSINAAVQATAATDLPDDAVIAAARRVARTVTADLLSDASGGSPADVVSARTP